MKEYWNQTKSVIENETIDLTTKWILMVLGITSIAAAVVSYAYPQRYPVELALGLIGVSLISKAQGRGKYIQMPWKTYCWFYALVIVSTTGYGLVMMNTIIPKLSAVQLISFPLSILCMVATYGFVYKKNMLTKKFWKTMFVLYLVSISWDYIQRALGAESFSLANIGLMYLSFLLFVPSYYAFGMYAFNRSIDGDDLNAEDNNTNRIDKMDSKLIMAGIIITATATPYYLTNFESGWLLMLHLGGGYWGWRYIRSYFKDFQKEWEKRGLWKR